MPRIRLNWLLIGIGLVIATIVVDASLGYRQIQQVHNDAFWVTHTHEVLEKLDRVLSGLRQLAAGQRGYILTGNKDYLRTYDQACKDHKDWITDLRGLLDDNPTQLARLDRLETLSAQEIDRMTGIIPVRREQGFEAARDLVAAGMGYQPLAEIREIFDNMRADEAQLLDQRRAISQRTFQSAIYGNLVGAAVGLFAVAAFGWLLRRHLQAMTRAATEVHQQRELLQATLTSIGDGVIATDARGRVTFLNAVAQTITGWTQAEADGQPLETVFNIVNEATRQPVDNPAERALHEGRIVGLANHTVLIAKNGEEWPIDDSAAPIRDESGKLTGAILVFREIRERKRQEQDLRRYTQELQQADRRKDEFLATLAHELRNPLSPISNALQLWPMVENNPREMHQIRDMMARQVKQMTRLIDDLMDVSRITRGKIQLRKQPVDVSTLVAGAVEAIEPLIDACGHQLTVVPPDGQVLVDGDAARLTQVFGNILNNAAKYTGRNGQIWVAVERQNGDAQIRIRDNGPGIPPEMLGEVFEMFRQVDGTLDRAHGGLGIGLTLVKQLVELHGGKVEARSAGPGTGSEFVVSLPVLESGVEPPTADAPPESGKLAGSLPRRKVLVVDDIPAAAETLALMLRAIGQEVSIAGDGPSAIDWIAAHRPDVVFLDIAMPSMNGYEVAQRVRQQADSGSVMLVALTGYGQDEDRKRAFEAGFNQHLTKPATIEVLQQVLWTVPHAR